MRALRFITRHIGAILTVAIAFWIVRTVVVRNRAPGSMTILEAQAMDMGTSTTPVGAAPVDIEDVRETPIAPTVRYSATVSAFNDEDVTARVAGRVLRVNVYPGDRVRAGQVVAQLDSAELRARADESAAGQDASAADVTVSRAELRQAEARRTAAERRLAAAASATRESAAAVDAARAQRDQAASAVREARAALQTAEAAVGAARADSTYWREEIARQQALYRQGVISTEELQRDAASRRTADSRFDQAVATVREKRAAADSAEGRARQSDAVIAGAGAQLERARNEQAAVRSDLDASSAEVRTASARISQRHAMVRQSAAGARATAVVAEYTVLRATQDAVVSERLVSPGSLVEPGTVVLRLKSDSRVRVQAAVSEVDAQGVRPGLPVWITPQDRGARAIRARITSVAGAADPVTRTVIVEAVVPAAAGLRPSGYVTMRIATAVEHMAITVPAAAVRRGADQRAYVWIAEDAPQKGPVDYTCLMHPEIHEPHPGKCPKCGMDLVPSRRGGSLVARRVSIRTGSGDGARVEVLSGLVAGSRVIVRGHDYLQDGDSVAPAPRSANGQAEQPPAAPAANPTQAPMPSMPGMVMPGDRGAAR